MLSKVGEHNPCWKGAITFFQSHVISTWYVKSIHQKIRVQLISFSNPAIQMRRTWLLLKGSWKCFVQVTLSSKDNFIINFEINLSIIDVSYLSCYLKLVATILAKIELQWFILSQVMFFFYKFEKYPIFKAAFA